MKYHSVTEIIQRISVSNCILRGRVSRHSGERFCWFWFCAHLAAQDLSHRQTATQQKSIEHIRSFTLCYYNSANEAIPSKGTVSTIKPWEGKKKGRVRDIIYNVKLQCGFTFSGSSLPHCPVSAPCPIHIGIFHGNKAITIPIPPW